MVSNDLSAYLSQRFEQMLRWDSHRLTVEKLKWYASHIEQQGGGDIVWGYVDGTLQQICRPTLHQRMYYSGHKHRHGFKFQAVITPDGLFSSLFGPVVGSRGDWYLFQQSGIEMDIKKLFDDANIPEEERLYIYGDPAYTGSSAIMKAYKRSQKDQLTAARKKFNKKMSRKQMSVKHRFEFVQKY